MKTLVIKDKIWVHAHGRTYSLPVRENKQRQGSEEVQELLAPFSCKVLKVHVKTSQKVKKGDPIVVVEAMKMEYSYNSPRDGTVDPLVKEGEILSAGAKFVRWKEGS